MTERSYEERAALCMESVKAKNPLTHCMTNMVSMDFMANVLLAGGCSPAMVHGIQEVEEFVKIPGGLLINIGTLDEKWVESFELAARVAESIGKPWVLDPVGVGATTYRTDVCKRLIRFKPAVIRGNASEIIALAHCHGQHGGKGVDSTLSSESAIEVAKSFAERHGCIVAVSGETDYVTDGQRVLAVTNGVPMLQQITASGCAVTALIAAYIAAKPEEESILEATAYALGIFGLAAQLASSSSAIHGPGSLRVGLIDTLYSLSRDQVKAGVKIALLQ